ncbi:MAG: hypothetical protein KDK65_00910 [Chlamydiia bacterium]|nr:hypothetical protein [Chlamydiia bacterium]
MKSLNKKEMQSIFGGQELGDLRIVVCSTGEIVYPDDLNTSKGVGKGLQAAISAGAALKGFKGIEIQVFTQLGWINPSNPGEEVCGDFPGM